MEPRPLARPARHTSTSGPLRRDGGDEGASPRRSPARRAAKTIGGVGAGLGCIALLGSGAGPADARQALSGQCGVQQVNSSYSISSDGTLTYSVAGAGTGRSARFRFFGGDYGSNYVWHSYQYRYAVRVTNFGPQSNEVVRFGEQRNSPSDQYWSEYTSPDSHNSNLANNSVPTQSIGSVVSPGSNTEIWTKAIFDVPHQPDPSCWTNAIATK